MTSVDTMKVDNAMIIPHFNASNTCVSNNPHIIYTYTPLCVQ